MTRVQPEHGVDTSPRPCYYTRAGQEHNIQVTKTSILTRVTHTREIDVTEEQLQAWRNGNRLIQDEFPHLSAEDREFLLSGIVPSEWVAMIANETTPLPHYKDHMKSHAEGCGE